MLEIESLYSADLHLNCRNSRRALILWKSARAAIQCAARCPKSASVAPLYFRIPIHAYSNSRPRRHKTSLRFPRRNTHFFVRLAGASSVCALVRVICGFMRYACLLRMDTSAYPNALSMLFGCGFGLIHAPNVVTNDNWMCLSWRWLNLKLDSFVILHSMANM